MKKVRDTLENILVGAATGGVIHGLQGVVEPVRVNKVPFSTQLELKVINDIRKGEIDQVYSKDRPYLQRYYHRLVQQERELELLAKELKNTSAVQRNLEMVRSNKAKVAQLAKVSGSGDYIFPKKLVRGIMSGAGGLAGRVAGGMYGGPLGSAIGGGAGAVVGDELARVVGAGDYSVMENTIYKKGLPIQPGQLIPSFGAGNNITRIKHREYVKDVLVPATNTTFTNVSYTLNPGNNVTFPWLSSVAANYQQYKFNGLLFEFRTLTSEVTAGGAMGSVIMATNYDVNDSTWADKLHMENSQYSISAKPSCGMIHTVECASQLTASKLLYVRNASTSSSSTSDNRFFDLGNFQIATVGLSATAATSIGELWVTYDISLYKPEVSTTISGQGQTISSGGTVSKTAVFGTATTGSGASIATASASTLTFNIPGQYLISLIVNAGTGLPITPAISGTASNFTSLWNEGAAGGTTMSTVYRVNITVAGQTAIVDYSGATTVTQTTTRIAQFNYANG